MKKHQFLYLFLLITILTGCRTGWMMPVPETELVFWTGNNLFKEIGFINTDGTDLALLNLRKEFRYPTWSSDGSLLLGLSGWGPTFGGYPSYWDVKKKVFKICSKNLPYFASIDSAGNLDNPAEAIIGNISEIIRMDLKNCQEVDVLVDSRNLAGFSLRSDTQELLYGFVGRDWPPENKIIKLNLMTGELIELAEGINPAWSPGGSEIVYTGWDGIYLMKADGSEQQLLVSLDLEPPRSHSYIDIFPKAKWTNDGEWILYHTCENSERCTIGENSIYKVPSKGGTPELIYTGGSNPVMRP